VLLTLLRHATLVLDIGGRRLIVDPMLDPPGARGPVRGTPDERPNPLVPLPVDVDRAVAGVEAVLLTHTHVDHLDAAGVSALSPSLPWFCQPEDVDDLTGIGLADVRPLPLGAAVGWQGVRIARTGGRHGREEAAVRGLGPVSGFVVAAEGEPTVYVAGDTVWCPEVQQALAEHDPDVVVVNAGGARFLQGGTVTMEADDVLAVCAAAPSARVVAVHMEAINHCLQGRAELRGLVEAAGLGERVAIPLDGEVCAAAG
jgi:L-ascorbate metabolism protein UlaG (beta-lactamase superfamily)